MSEKKRIALVLIDAFADWEYGLLAASAVAWFGCSLTVLTPGGRDVTSMAGVRVAADGALEKADAARFDAVVLIGSDGWTAGAAPEADRLARAVHDHGGTVGGICGGTVALARSGLLEGRAHTSNDRSWLGEVAGDYAGADLYRDTPAAVSDGRVVTAPGTAPATFAIAVLGSLLPGGAEQVAQMRAMMAAEHQAAD
ncbi:MAG: DJ-1/PfpI family protein [Roseitalea sp.]|nr:DJ-1/PfpI family protein [Roseitalea sp.]MBO6723807.1 DJ-1/PfpI family protein [Roseitalea sp.]MBO6741827.1 DJ-1/PfpI family protein [Roseitalea sp.]